MPRFAPLAALLLSCFLVVDEVPLATRNRSAAPDYAREIEPLFAKHCYACHGPSKQRGGLRIDRHSAAAKGGDSGALWVAGKPDESLLVVRVKSDHVEERMPQGKPPLQPAEIQLLTRWIEAGAPGPADDEHQDATHWAFTPLHRPKLPLRAAKQAASQSPVDQFIIEKLAEHGLTLSPEADRRTLLRRLKFDLLGLPPTPEEVEEFVSDPAQDAYERWVDRYLASPHFGERWARHWLDAVRFAESNGFETNQLRPNAYHYRDYVIQAFNSDLPYDQFVREQLAGDVTGAPTATGFLVGGAWDEVKSPDVTLTLNQRADELHDMVGTTSSTFLGLTVACARCHAHKFDPISQLDYFRVKAVFAGVQHGERLIREGDQQLQARQADAARSELKELEEKLASLEPNADPTATVARRGAVNARLNSERIKPIQARYLRFVIFETNQYEPCIDELEVFTSAPQQINVALAAVGTTVTSSGDYPHAPSIHRLDFLNDGAYGNGRSWISNEPGRGWVELAFAQPVRIERIVWARDREGKFADRLATRYRIDVSLDRKGWWTVASSEDRSPFKGNKSAGVPPSLTSEHQAEWRELTERIDSLRKRIDELTLGRPAYVGRIAESEPIFRLHRGDVMQPREVVGPGGLSQIGPNLDIPATATSGERRVALANWITDSANPLPARVMVNRLWQHHFGVGLVDTPSDFGTNGGSPSHPELLDWLAAELLANQWKLKAIHRLIVTSSTYRQASAHRADCFAKDAQSRLLWRYPPRRLEAESLRDAVLFVSGKLDLTPGGPGFDLFEPNDNYVKVYTPKSSFGPAEFRRMIYQRKPRMQLDDTFGAFDCPDAGQIAPRRNISNTPLQSLSLLNSPFMLGQSAFFAERIEAEVGTAAENQVRRAFALAYQRLPSPREAYEAKKLVQKHGLATLCRALLNANEFIYLD